MDSRPCPTYGLIAQIWVREGEAFTKELFQSKTLDEKTGWYDFPARQYAAVLEGRA